MVEGREIYDFDGRHAVVEQSLLVFLCRIRRSWEGEEGREKLAACPDLIILTGPNASGKSCYYGRWVDSADGSSGSFVPERLNWNLRRIFTRVGAVDDLATGNLRSW